MSYLYKALVKNNQPNNAVEQVAPHHHVNNGQFVHQPPLTTSHPSSSNVQRPPWLLVSILCIFILTTGLLAGYLFATQSSVLNAEFARNSITETMPDQQLKPPASILADEADINSQQANNDTPVDSKNAGDKLVEVSLSTNGEVISDVSAIEPETDFSNQTFTPVTTESIDEASLDEVPEALKLAFEQAVMSEQQIVETTEEPSIPTPDNVSDITQLPADIQTKVPTLNYEMHMYASEVTQRWIKVNGQRLMAGDYLTANLQLVSVEQSYSLWQLDQWQFAQPALVDHQGN